MPYMQIGIKAANIKHGVGKTGLYPHGFLLRPGGVLTPGNRMEQPGPDFPTMPDSDLNSKGKADTGSIKMLLAQGKTPEVKAHTCSHMGI